MLPDTIRIGEAKASRLLLVRAIETEDRDAVLLTADDRRYASHAAQSELHGRPGTRNGAARFLSRRADIALERLEGRFPSLNKYVTDIRWPVWLSLGIPLGALLLGLSTDAFAGKRLNIVAFPLLGLISWNLVVFAVLPVQWLAKAVRPKKEAKGWLGNLIRRITQPRSDRLAGQPTLERGLVRFAGDWADASGEVTDARLHRTLHLGAALFALGVIAAMLIRARYMAEYEAGWSGTWAGAEREIATLLRVVLGPASLLTGLPLPTAEQLLQLRGGGQNAGNWLLLWAVTGTLFVILPRLLLALLSGLRAEFLRRSLAIRQDFYFRGLLRDALGEPGKARVVAYGVDLTGERRQRLERMLRAVLGEKVSPSFDVPVAYGSEDEWLSDNAGALAESDYLILLFSLSSTPEAENHGAFASAMRERLAGGPASLIVLLEERALRARLQASASTDRRIAERVQAWNAVLAGAGVEPTLVSLDGAGEDEAARALECGLLRTPAAVR
ncbi:DUF2868 domain-containing protein [Sphingomonas glaciei]|uniref:DUF2868 domain-containing protein n=1 Tax=Sphingomonas glaciei TaxID=2938948 RepID=A0ABY5MYF7_9SPHN|nr:DUF2868 domain-containing protein [Sphingomonas glaciei]UUR09353.1 DUF2868 domain-containing protein [Sphingomonas glaciei]